MQSYLSYKPLTDATSSTMQSQSIQNDQEAR